MRTIVFVTQKGGSGKSTLAMCLAQLAAGSGRRVAVGDLDPQGSLVDWGRRRRACPVVPLTPGTLLGALAHLAERRTELVFLDTPAGIQSAALAAIAAADLCLIPVRPTILDLWSSEATVRAIRAAGKDFAFMLNQCPPAQQNARVAEAGRALANAGALVWPPIGLRLDFQIAAQIGRGVAEVNPRGKAVAEITAAWAAIQHRLALGEHPKGASAA